jgi:hypothetical protein
MIIVVTLIYSILNISRSLSYLNYFFNFAISIFTAGGLIFTIFGVTLSYEIYKETGDISQKIKSLNKYKNYSADKGTIVRDLEGYRSILFEDKAFNNPTMIRKVTNEILQVITKIELYTDIIEDNYDKNIVDEINFIKDIINLGVTNENRDKLLNYLSIIIGIIDIKDYYLDEQGRRAVNE